MRFYFWTTSLSLMAIVAVFSSCSKDEARLQAVSETQDFGVLPRESGVSQFSIKNVGNQDLIVDDVSTTGDCTVVDWPQRLQPGDTGEIEIQLGRSLGRNSASILVRCNDIQSIHQYFFTWYIQSEPSITPAMITFQNVNPAASVSEQVRISFEGSDRELSPTVEHFSTSSSLVEVEEVALNVDVNAYPLHVIDTHASLSGHIYNIKCVAPEKPGVYEESCQFLVAWSGGAKEFTVPIKMHVLGRIRCSGVFVFSGLRSDTKAGKKLGKTIMIQRGEADAPTLNIESPPYLRCNVTRTPNRDTTDAFAYRLNAELLHIPDDQPLIAGIGLSIQGEEFSLPVVIQFE